MILHLGDDCFVTLKHIIMILDYKEAVRNPATSLFLQRYENTLSCGDGEPKSAVITDEGGGTVYLSHISSRTLLKRFHTEQHFASCGTNI